MKLAPPLQLGQPLSFPATSEPPGGGGGPRAKFPKFGLSDHTEMPLPHNAIPSQAAKSFVVPVPPGKEANVEFIIRQHTPPLSSMVKTIKQQHRQLPVHRASILASKHLNGKKSAQIPCVLYPPNSFHTVVSCFAQKENKKKKRSHRSLSAKEGKLLSTLDAITIKKRSRHYTKGGARSTADPAVCLRWPPVTGHHVVSRQCRPWSPRM